MLHQKRKKEPGDATLARVKNEMARPRMAKSARIAELILDTARIPEQPNTTNREDWCLLVQDNTQEGTVDLNSVIVVLNEAEFPEFIHEKVDSGARCANHFR